MSSTNKNHLAKWLRWAGRIIALPVATFYSVFALGEFVDSITNAGLQQAMQVGGLLGGVTTVIALAGCIISWWWLLPAGVLLIFAYLFGGVSSGLVAVYHVGELHLNQFRDLWTIPGVIFLIAGVLFIVSWWLSKKTKPALPNSPKA